MRLLPLLPLSIATLGVLPPPVAGQDVGPLGSTRIREILRRAAPVVPASLTPPPSKVNCDRYVLSPTFPPKPVAKLDEGALKGLGTVLTDVTECLNELQRALKLSAEAASSAKTNQEVIRARIDYKRLKKWIPGPRDIAPAATPTKEWLAARRAELEVGRQLPITLKTHDLFATFAAVLVTGASLVDANQPDEGDEAAASSSEDTDTAADAEQGGQALGTIVWQSRHFGDESIGRFDLSVGGRIGMQPVLNLVTSTPPADAAEGATATVSAVHQNAFVWTAGVQAHKPIRGINSELTWYGSLGSSTLSSLPKAVDKGQGSFLAFPLDYGAQRTAWLWELGTSFEIFDNPLEQIHAEKGTTTPQFQMLVALRRDDRFRGALFDDYRRSAGRLLFRLTLDAIRVFDRRQFGESTQPFTFGFVVEHERSLAFTGQRVPSATRFVLRGDVNLLRALNGSAKAEVADDSDGAAETTHRWTIEAPGASTLPVAKDATSVRLELMEVKIGTSSVVTSPAPAIEVSLEKGDLLPIPACPGATVKFTLAAGAVTATPTDWNACKGAITVLVREGGDQ